MEKVLFNLNDVALLLVIAECLLLIILVLGTQLSLRHRWLALLLASFVLDASATLLYWCEPLRQLFPLAATKAYLWLQFALLAQGPLLYAYTRSTLFPNHDGEHRDDLPNPLLTGTWRHFLPLVLFPLLIVLLLNNLGAEQLRKASEEYGVLASQSLFDALQVSQRMLCLVYAILSLLEFRRFDRYLRQHYSTIEGLDQTWLKLIILGFLALSLIHIAAGGSNMLGLFRVDHWLSLAANYGNFIFINTLVFYNLQRSSVIRPYASDHTTAASIALTQNDDNQDLAQRIYQSVEEQAMYLEPELTLEQLAQRLGLPARQVSNAINQVLNQNFFELINHFRSEKAKSLLKDPNCHLNMLDIMHASGFNSKSAFNRCFKKHTDLTPTAFRKQQLSDPVPHLTRSE